MSEPPPDQGRVNRENTLVEVLSEFAHTLVTDFPVQGILDHLVARIVDLLPIDAAGVALISSSMGPQIVAGSDDSAKRYESLQAELGEGPCLAAYESELPVCIPHLAGDDRFPKYAERALADGLAAVFTFPLRTEDRCLGALDLYRVTAGDLSDEEMKTAQILADVATAYLVNAESKSAGTKLVATVSHELRTPLTNIAAFVELLQGLDGVPRSSKHEQYLDAIARSSDRLTTLASDLLAVSRLNAGMLSSKHVDLDLGTVISTVRSSLDAAIEARNLDVSFTVPPVPVMVQGDHAELESMVSNLVGNALKFTNDGGWVHCNLEAISGNAIIEVSDSGLGIPEDEQSNIFTQFFRSSTAREHAIQGTGLGLSIVASVARSHGGDVSFVSAHMKGSTFTVTLPLSETDPRGPNVGPAAVAGV